MTITRCGGLGLRRRRAVAREATIASSGKRRGLALALALLAGGAFTGPATGHSGSALLGLPLDPTDPPPVVDGSCDDVAYAGGWRFSRVHYRPEVSLPPAKVHLVASETDLFVCVERLTFGFSSSDSVAVLHFDPDHSGSPLIEDLQFRITDRGQIDAFSCTEFFSGCNTPPELEPSAGNWTAARGLFTEFDWNAEYRINLDLIGGGERGSTTGFSVLHRNVETASDTFAWPRQAAAAIPDTWADLIWLLRDEEVRVDQARITQGLEQDLSAGVAYDLIAGKKTLVRAQLFSARTNRIIDDSSHCAVQRQQPTRGNRHEIGLQRRRGSFINQIAYGMFNGSPFVECWVPGELLDQPGTYRFKINIRFEGESRFHEVDLGTKRLVDTGNLNILVLPADAHDSANDGRDWASDLTAAVPPAMHELNRLFPLSDEVSAFPITDPAPQNGLGYLLWPAVDTCRDGETRAACGDRRRSTANDFLRFYNALADARGDGGGRIARHAILGASLSTGGGQAQLGRRPCSSGLGFDNNPRGASATVLVQELAHCLGQVSSDSPNTFNRSAPVGHSMNTIIPILPRRPVVNALTQRDSPLRTRSSMFATVTNIVSSYMEGWEWNNLRETLVNLSPAGKTTTGGVKGAQTERFRFVGRIDADDNLDRTYSRRLGALAMPVTASQPGGAYTFVYIDEAGQALSSTAFDVGFEQTEHAGSKTSPERKHGEARFAAIDLILPLPPDSHGFEIRKGTSVLFSDTFSSTPPVLSDVSASFGGQGPVSLDWTASDADSSELRHNVFLLPGDDAIPLLLAHGLTTSELTVDSALLPAVPNVRFRVETTDGLGFAQAESAAIQVFNRTPLVSIARPNSDTPDPVAGQPTSLLGSAYDATDGELGHSSLQWRSDLDGPLGQGMRLEVALSEGTHNLRLEATDSGGLTGIGTTQVTVLADTDGDGLPDGYEAGHECLSASVPETALDHDADAIATREERRIGTDPCAPDSDGDGIGDGDESRQSSDPNNPSSLPPVPALFVDANQVDLGVCPQSVSETVGIRTDALDTPWQVSTGPDWLSVTPTAGTGADELELTVECNQLPDGADSAEVVISTADETVIAVTVTAATDLLFANSFE